MERPRTKMGRSPVEPKGWMYESPLKAFAHREKAERRVTKAEPAG